MNFLKRNLTINLNFSFIFLFSYFFTYGFFGSRSFDYLNNNQFLFFGFDLFIIFIFYWLLSYFIYKNYNHLTLSLNLTFYDFFIFLFFLLFFSLITFTQLNFSLYIDEISYAVSPFTHAYEAIKILIKYLPFLEKFEFNFLLQIISIFLFFFISIIFYLIHKVPNFFTKSAILFVVIIFFRIFIIFNDGNFSSHPPLKFIPTLIFGCLFGISDISIKLSCIACFSLYAFSLYKLLSCKFSSNNSLMIVFVILTIPITLNYAPLLEHSIWAYMLFTYLCVYVLCIKNYNFLFLTSLISIFTLFRQTAFIAFIPLFFLYLNTYKFNYVSISNRFFPFLLFTPFLLSTFTFGTNASNPIVNILDSFKNLLFVFESEHFYNSIREYIGIYFYFIIIFFFDLLRSKKYKFFYFFVLFFILIFCLYYLQNKDLWSLQKYKLEIYVPFISISIIYFLGKISKKIFPFYFISIVFILININIYLNIIKNNQLSSSINFKYNEAYEDLIKFKMDSGILCLTCNYEINYKIISGLNTKNVFESLNIYLNNKNHLISNYFNKDSIDKIDNNLQINTILISNMINFWPANISFQSTIDYFQILGWTEFKRYSDSDHNSIVVILARGKN